MTVVKTTRVAFHLRAKATEFSSSRFFFIIYSIRRSLSYVGWVEHSVTQLSQANKLGFVPQPNLLLEKPCANQLILKIYTQSKIGESFSCKFSRPGYIIISQAAVRLYRLPSYLTRFYIRIESPLSPEQVWTLLTFTRQIPICQFRHRRAQAEVRATTRNP